MTTMATPMSRPRAMQRVARRARCGATRPSATTQRRDARGRDRLAAATRLSPVDAARHLPRAVPAASSRRAARRLPASLEHALGDARLRGARDARISRHSLPRSFTLRDLGARPAALRRRDRALVGRPAPRRPRARRVGVRRGVRCARTRLRSIPRPIAAIRGGRVAVVRASSLQPSVQRLTLALSGARLPRCGASSWRDDGTDEPVRAAAAPRRRRRISSSIASPSRLQCRRRSSATLSRCSTSSRAERRSAMRASGSRRRRARAQRRSKRRSARGFRSGPRSAGSAGVERRLSRERRSLTSRRRLRPCRTSSGGS